MARATADWERVRAMATVVVGDWGAQRVAMVVEANQMGQMAE